MASIKEIRTHIKSVEQTLKITNAMYLISSSNLRKARKQLTDVEPYFMKIEATISDILHHSPEISHVFFDKRPGVQPEDRKIGYIVITGDKGLAGAYNHNILKLAEQKMSESAHTSLFVVGQVGRSYFQEHGVPIDVEFLYTAQDPNMGRARDMAELMLDLYLEERLDEVYITVNKNAIPNDPEKPFVTSGIRVGTPAVTSRGFREEEMKVVGRLICQAAQSDFESQVDALRAQVKELTGRYPLYQNV